MHTPVWKINKAVSRWYSQYENEEIHLADCPRCRQYDTYDSSSLMYRIVAIEANHISLRLDHSNPSEQLSHPGDSYCNWVEYLILTLEEIGL